MDETKHIQPCPCAWCRVDEQNTVEFLQARLIERTEQSTLTAYRDAEVIRGLRESLLKWEGELSKVMPPDFKDWWENSRSEWPLIARLTIESLKKREALAWGMAEPEQPDHPLMWWFKACPECGNKRCPKRTDDALACTGSNEPGQAGSDF